MVARSEADTYAACDRAIPIGSAMVALAIRRRLSLLLDAAAAHAARKTELQALARDGLTGLDNRRMLDVARARRAVPRARSTRCRCCSSTSITSSATTTRKGIAGDDALAAVGHCIAGCLRRPTDYAARYGGEEFVVVLPDIDTDGAVTIAETIRTGILDLGIRHDAGTSDRLTVSIGVTTSYPEHDDDMQGRAEAGRRRAVSREGRRAQPHRRAPGRFRRPRAAGLSGRTRHAAERWPSKGRTAPSPPCKIADNVADLPPHG